MDDVHLNEVIFLSAWNFNLSLENKLAMMDLEGIFDYNTRECHNDTRPSACLLLRDTINALVKKLELSLERVYDLTTSPVAVAINLSSSTDPLISNTPTSSLVNSAVQ